MDYARCLRAASLELVRFGDVSERWRLDFVEGLHYVIDHKPEPIGQRLVSGGPADGQCGVFLCVPSGSS